MNESNKMTVNDFHNILMAHAKDRFIG